MQRWWIILLTAGCSSGGAADVGGPEDGGFEAAAPVGTIGDPCSFKPILDDSGIPPWEILGCEQLFKQITIATSPENYTKNMVKCAAPDPTQPDVMVCRLSCGLTWDNQLWQQRAEEICAATFNGTCGALPGSSSTWCSPDTL